MRKILRFFPNFVYVADLEHAKKLGRTALLKERISNIKTYCTDEVKYLFLIMFDDRSDSIRAESLIKTKVLPKYRLNCSGGGEIFQTKDIKKLKAEIIAVLQETGINYKFYKPRDPYVLKQEVLLNDMLNSSIGAIVKRAKTTQQFKKNTIVVPRAVIEDLNRLGAAGKFWLYLYSINKTRKLVKATTKGLAKDTNKAQTTIRRYIKRLSEEGYLRVVDNGRSTKNKIVKKTFKPVIPLSSQNFI